MSTAPSMDRTPVDPPRNRLAALFLLTALAVALVAPPARSQDARSDPNAAFLDPALDVETWESRFETESREVFALRGEIVGALELPEGAVVADVGAGTGAFLEPLARAVGPHGRYYAVEISPRFVEHLRDRAREAGLENVTAVLGRTDDATLPPASVDLVFVCDTYHHFSDPPAVLASLHRALRPGGRLAVVDFDRVEGASSEWVLGHVRASKEEFRREIEAAGFSAAREVDMEGLEENFFLLFERP
jgi:SAM-dependent methyltransferase